MVTSTALSRGGRLRDAASSRPRPSALVLPGAFASLQTIALRFHHTAGRRRLAAGGIVLSRRPVVEEEPVAKAEIAAPDAVRPYLESYGRMLLIRLFEQEMHRLFLKGEIHGTTHLAAGQEAVPVGVCQALEPEDYVAGTYRGHGHALAKGSDPEGMAAEMLGRASGTCGGRSGSMNVIDRSVGLVGCYGIVGGSIGAATGAAMSAKRQGRVSVAFFGDGATNQAYFFECLNFVKVFELPAVFVCENNWYGEFTPMQKVTAGQDIAKRAEPFGVPSSVVDGNDLWAVVDAATEAVGRARSGGGPTLLECQTYRHYGHSKSDPAKYRPKEEVERWLARDPLKIARARLLEEGLDEAAVDAVEDATRRVLDEAIEAALAAPYPDPAVRATEFAA
jgi:TPP-dependent pyruvate/acetoin dehydrogenase alpha subunit